MIIKLQKFSGDHLGFILFANDANNSGDCIFSPLSASPDLIYSREYDFLLHCRELGEFMFHLETDREILHIQNNELELCFKKNLIMENI